VARAWRGRSTQLVEHTSSPGAAAVAAFDPRAVGDGAAALVVEHHHLDLDGAHERRHQERVRLTRRRRDVARWRT
jgi:hypothetical protein